METLLIVDGSNLLFQMFYGMPARIVNHRGKAIQGTLGFVGALLRMVRMVNPSHVLVVFDGEYENPRAVLDENYKANRPDYSEIPEEQTPFSQLPDIYDALDCLGIRRRETESCEADDWIAAYAEKAGMPVVIASQDSDFFQLISENTRILRYRGEKSVLWGPETLRQKLGIHPAQYGFYKALTGDSADNIPGIRGIGPKTAARLVNQFGSLDALLADYESITAPALRSCIGENTRRLRLNYHLIQLRGTGELPFPVEELRWQDPGLTTTQVLKATGLRE